MKAQVLTQYDDHLKADQWVSLQEVADPVITKSTDCHRAPSAEQGFAALICTLSKAYGVRIWIRKATVCCL